MGADGSTRPSTQWLVSQGYSRYHTGRACWGAEAEWAGTESPEVTAVIRGVMHLAGEIFWLQFGCLQKAGLAMQGLRGSLVLRP